MAWVEERGGVFRVRMRTAEGRIVDVVRCGSLEEAQEVARVLPVARVDAVARRSRREVARSLAMWDGLVRPGPGSDPRLSEWVAAWRVGLSVRASTLERYESHLRIHVLPRFGRMRLSEISRVDVRAWALSLKQQGMAGSSVCSIVALLSGILAEAVREGLLAFNPVVRLRVASDRPVERAVADAAQIRALAARMGGSHGLMTVTGAYTGMRWGELAGLHRENVVLEQRSRRAREAFVPHIRVDGRMGALHEVAGRLEVGPVKTGAGERLVHLPPFLVGLLRKHLAAHPFPYVFTGERGGWLRRAVFRKQVWLPAMDGFVQPEDGVGSGRGAMTFHSLRHTHKTWMAEHHTPPSLQDYRMGHCPRGIAGRYEHPTAVMVAELMGELEQRWHTAERTDCPPT
jgi:integrase